MGDTTRPERVRRGLSGVLLVVACGAMLLFGGALLLRPLWPVGFEDDSLPATPRERQGVPGAVLQRTFRLAVPPKAGETSYLVVPGDGSAESGQDLYLRFRTTPEGLKEFLTSLDETTRDLATGRAVLDQDDIDSVGLPWRIGPEDHLAGLYADIPEKGDRAGSARVTVDESERGAPLVYAHVTV
ncbi:hypothetical protein [Streptomyces sp. NPDC047042]|uniref:hypothetical protein n=1 Tax=Streptomyces sp. NPDC047042 TaxID=3154807 RepID=UPI0033E0934D